MKGIVPLVDRRQAMALVGGTLAVTPLAVRAQQADESGGLSAQRLRCEWLFDPLGIDTLRPRFCWELAAAGDRRGQHAARMRVLVASTPDLLLQRQGDVWDSGDLVTRLPRAQPDDPLPLTSHTPYHWMVGTIDQAGTTRWSTPATFATGLLAPSDWRGQWIAARPDRVVPAHFRGRSPDGPLSTEETVLPLLRRRFILPDRPARAIISLAGMGHFELTVNGHAVTTSVLNPGWTEYNRTVLYSTYDVTDLLQPGDNMLGVMLGNGMFNVERKADRKSKFVDSYGKPKLLLQMTLLRPDGTTSHLASDAEWETSDGPILFSSMYGGEDVDARREQVGWDLPGASVAGWTPVLPAGAPAGRLKAQAVPPVIVHERFTTIAVTEAKPGIFIYDLGQNFSGRPHIVVRGPAGMKVRFTPAEVLGPDGLVFQRSFNAGPGRWVTYEYTLAGSGEERFVPRFTYHGFRYIQVEGAIPTGGGAEIPQVMTIQGEFLFSDLPRVGTFDCSKPLFNQIHSLIERAVVSNSFSILTDCPHREKLAWLEQTHLNAATIMYNRDSAALYEKLVDDINDTQRADGMVPGIAPEYVAFLDAQGRDLDARNSPEWGAAVILASWAAYQSYGDPQPLATGYPAMRRYLDYLAGRAEGDLVDFGLGDWYDVGPGSLGASQLTNRALTGSATWYQALVTTARIAELFGNTADAQAFADQARRVLVAFNRRFFNSARNSYDRGSQTACAMPLALGMVPAGREPAVLDALVEAVRANANAVTAGDVGFHYVVRALAHYGRDDVLFDMMSVTESPSYGYQIARGATALTEAWDADPTKSNNHFMLGHGEGWLFGYLGGIQVDFSRRDAGAITIAPRPVGDVTSATASLRTIHGEVRSAWQRAGGLLTMDVLVPPGVEATVIVPTATPDAVREGGRRLRGAPGIRPVSAEAAGLRLVVGSGQYRFTAPFEGLPR
ncbi:family 78 glycoside hydrolase catalytic domain [Croceibacterium sp. TMG7-5b_MA50]|uniref:family 78 glycoside hydrolase catalytic domain n=1 Tax=Croceibacterium sp. TMG7-5b_MA50 TaxID=3121290 RepID=UPI0032216E40